MFPFGTYFVRVLNGKRDRLAKYLYDKGIYTTLRYHPLHLNPIYKSTARLPNCERLNEEGLNLPAAPQPERVGPRADPRRRAELWWLTLKDDLPVVILGGGCAGLSAGMRLSKRGPAGRRGRAGGPRRRAWPAASRSAPTPTNTARTPSTPRDPEILSDVKELMGAELTEYQRSIRIRFLGSYFQFPLTIRDVLFRLPVQDGRSTPASASCGTSRRPLSRPAEENSETLLMRYYGRVLYEIFFKSYIVKVWGISPAEFSPSFARERIPRLNLLVLHGQDLVGDQAPPGHQGEHRGLRREGGGQALYHPARVLADHPAHGRAAGRSGRRGAAAHQGDARSCARAIGCAPSRSPAPPAAPAGSSAPGW